MSLLFTLVDSNDVCGKQAGYNYTDHEHDAVFKRIYGIFGSSVPYQLFEDAKPFLRWVRAQGIMVGVLSNASYRYRDDILPQLGLKQVRFRDDFFHLIFDL